MELTTLSKLELQRLEIIQSILDKRLSVVDAGEHLGLSRSQVHRLLQRYRLNGAAGLASGKRGKRDVKRSGNAPRRTGQTDHMF